VAVVPDGLDVTASQTGDRVYLHVVSTCRTQSVSARLSVNGRAIRSGTVFEIAADPEIEILADNASVLAPVTKSLPEGARWKFPPASVSTVELVLQ
jgi:hypothetical protein